jgi:molecular chaperone DnaJ
VHEAASLHLSFHGHCFRIRVFPGFFRMPRRVVCYYQILGIPIRASQEDIKRAFRLLALRWHPDRHPDEPQAAESFRKALEAYETLVDPSARIRYDRLRGYTKTAQKVQRDLSFDDEEVDRRRRKKSSVKDTLYEFFGVEIEAVRRSGVTDLRFDLQVPGSVACKGVCEEIRFSRIVFCGACRGGNGNGRKRAGGCPSCNGDGEIEEFCSMEVRIPAGIEHGARIRIQGAGDRIAPNVPPGDLVILIQIIAAH